MKQAFIGLGVFLLVMAGITWYNYTQHYNQDNKDTATSGIFFKTTLNLKEYKNVSTGNDLWGTFDVYSRSDRHTETLKIYCNKYCK